MTKTFVHSFAAAALLATAAVAAHAAPLEVSAHVDTEFCASGAVQCSLAGNSFTAATDLNNNPVRLFVHVARGSTGANVSLLPLTSFSFRNNLVPAGSSGAVICPEANCTKARFSVGPDGAYSIILDRTADNWKAGTYAGTITVTNGVDTGSALVTFRVPGAAALSAAMAPAAVESADGMRRAH